MNGKRKGDDGERELVGMLQGLDAHRNRQWDIGGYQNPDVSLPGIHVECKRVERLNLEAAMRQAERDAGGAAVPVVAHRRNRRPWLVTMHLDTWLEMYKAWKAGG